MKRRAEIQIVKKNADKKPNLQRRPSLIFQPPKGLGLELKNVDLANAFTPTGTAAWSTPAAANTINLIAQGAGDGQRVGRKIMMKSFQMRWTWGLAATTTGGSPLRVLVIFDRQSNGALPATLDVLEQDDINSPMELGHNERFVVISSFYTEPISVQNNFSVAGEVYKKINLEATYNGAAGTIAQVITGAVFIMIAQTGAAGTVVPTFRYYARIRYTDV